MWFGKWRLQFAVVVVVFAVCISQRVVKRAEKTRKGQQQAAVGNWPISIDVFIFTIYGVLQQLLTAPLNQTCVCGDCWPRIFGFRRLAHSLTHSLRLSVLRSGPANRRQHFLTFPLPHSDLPCVSATAWSTPQTATADLIVRRQQKHTRVQTLGQHCKQTKPN